MAGWKNLVDDHPRGWKECHITLVDLVVWVGHYMCIVLVTKSD
jgi:hypothetical protein